jgi:hypothetical protein
MKPRFTAALLATVMLVSSQPAAAIDHIRIQAAAVQGFGSALQQVDARLTISSAKRSTLVLRTGRVRLPASLESQAGELGGVVMTCVDPVIQEPVLACTRLSAQLRTSKLSTLRISAQARYDMYRGELAASGSGPAIAGAAPEFTVAYSPKGWKGESRFPAMPIAAWQAFLKPWFAIPASFTVSGDTRLGIQVEADSQGTRAALDLALRNVGFQNADFTWLGEKLNLSVQGSVDLSSQPLRFEVETRATQGQALTGTAVFDFSANGLLFTAQGTFTQERLAVEHFASRQKGLAESSGSADISLKPFAVAAASVDIRDIRFPAAYTAFLQQPLATTAFNQLTTTGSASASLRIAGNQPVALTLNVDDLSFSDDTRGLAVTGVQAGLNWAAGAVVAEKPSFLAWNNARGWGISGAGTRIDFATHDRDVRLLQPARLPFFDGAMLINTLVIHHLGELDMAGDFDALIEPISIASIARALGWPEFGGSLAGRIPGLTYRNKELTLQGDIEAQVFDGRVFARNLRIRDPLGQLPRLYADITARNLDLDLITRTFEFGSITGKLDIDLPNLQTVGLSPVAFDLRIATPPGDRSRHRISQRAVQSLSNIGGSGGGVAAALQSGALRFFDEFGYARLGLNCRLRNDVCQMSGAGPGPAGTGFYIVKGAGLPRIDIIGNNPQVAWLTFVSQAANALANPGEINVR